MKVLLLTVHDSSVDFRKPFAGQLAPTGMIQQVPSFKQVLSLLCYRLSENMVNTEEGFGA
jgi:hypothetical protein